MMSEYMSILAYTKYSRYQKSHMVSILNVRKGCLPVISYEPLFRTMKEKGVTSYRLGKMGFPLSNFYAMKRGDNVSTHTINQLCRLLHCRVEDVMEFIDEE